MFVTANRFTVENEEKGQKLIERFAEGSGGITEQSGFVRFEFLSPSEDGDTYISQTYWESEEDFETWTESEHFENAHSGDSGEEILTDHPTLETYDVEFSHE